MYPQSTPSASSGKLGWSRGRTFFGLFIPLLLVLVVLSLFVGSVSIPASDVWSILTGDESQKSSWRFIVMETRLPAALTAVLCGSALAVCGLMLQTAFRNPLAGPGVFGISNGAALGVALVMLASGGSVMSTAFSLSGFMTIIIAAFLGAMAVTALIFLFSLFVRNNVMLLVVGIMVGYLSSAAISLLNFAATEDGVRSYMVWGLGSFGGVSMRIMPYFAAITLLGLFGSCLLLKPLNALLLGERYAEGLGIRTRRVRNWLLLVTGLLCAVTTAFCGPIAFLGLAVPHMARLLLGTENHRLLLPATMLLGAVVAIACHLASFLFSDSGAVPINAITPLIGAPVIIYVILRQRV
ncbi:MAG: iron ABC transporter permease [Prevotella sp.]|nr:iron ABC transporter permease [Prevotella sp.]